MTDSTSGAVTRLRYRGKVVQVHHGHLDAKDCPWDRGQVFTCPRCKRVACYCFGGEGRLCDDCWCEVEAGKERARIRKAGKARAA